MPGQTYGKPTFQLSFHLPYYAYRKGSPVCEDYRKNLSTGPLRQYEDVTFLEWHDPKKRLSSL